MEKNLVVNKRVTALACVLERDAHRARSCVHPSVCAGARTSSCCCPPISLGTLRHSQGSSICGCAVRLRGRCPRAVPGSVDLDGLALGDLIEDRWVGSPVDAVIDSNVRDETANILKTLSPKEEKVIRLRFGIGCEREHTLEEIGQQFDVTRERIRQIEAKALRQLRSPERARHLRALLAAR